MSRLNKDAALESLLRQGPWDKGSAHGYPTATMSSKFGAASAEKLEHCHFCFEDYPFHREYCPWDDYFFSVSE